MHGPEQWTIPERYMVRYHLSHLTWWAIAAVGVLILAIIVVLALTAAHVLRPVAANSIWWYAAFPITLVFTGASFVVKDMLLARATSDWSTHQVVTLYKRATTITVLLCLLAGLIPCALAAWYGQPGWPLLIAIVPVAALIVQFPRGERFRAFVDDLTQSDG